MLLELYGHEVMRGQLRHLAEFAQQGKTTIQVVPYRAGAHAGTTGPFVILDSPEPTDPAVVYVGEAFTKTVLASMPVDDGEAGRFGEDPCRGVEVRQPSGEGGGRQAFGQRLVELEAGQCPLVHIGQAQPLGGVGRSGLPHLAGQVGAHPEAGVVEALDAVGQVGQGRGEGGVGAVAGPGPPADVLTGRG